MNKQAKAQFMRDYKQKISRISIKNMVIQVQKYNLLNELITFDLSVLYISYFITRRENYKVQIMRISVDNNEYIQPPENRPTSPAYIIHHIITLALTMMLMACLVTYEIITPILAEIDMNRRIQAIKKSSEIEITQYNLQNSGKQFGDDFSIKLEDSPIRPEDIMYGIENTIQVGTFMDHINLTKTINFIQLKQKMMDSIAHQVIKFKEKQVEDKREFIEMISSEQYKKAKKRADSMTQDDQMDLTIELTRNIDSPYYRMVEYLYADKKFNISHNTQQIPMCVISPGYNIISKNKHALYFESIQRQNYSNYDILYIDDYSTDQTTYRILDYLNSSNFKKIKGRITIVHNLQGLGGAANFYFWIQKYCKEGSIVVNPDSDDSLVGTQTLQILNAVYKNPEVWYAYSKYLDYFQNWDFFQMGASKQINGSIQTYRTQVDIWVTSHLKTYRQKLMKVAPMPGFMEYRYNSTTQLASPRFFVSGVDRFIYNLLELSGDQRVMHITNPLYLYDPEVSTTDRKCYRSEQLHNQYKSRMKTPYQKLTSFHEIPKYVENYNPPQEILDKLMNYASKIKSCHKNPKKP